jgi:hypothetical protein
MLLISLVSYAIITSPVKWVVGCNAKGHFALPSQVTLDYRQSAKGDFYV